VAAELRKNPDLDVQLTDGAQGEFSILAEGREVISKADQLPTVEQAVAAVNDGAMSRPGV
jgi:hypothetical protein